MRLRAAGWVARVDQSTGCETHTRSRGLRRECGGEEQVDSSGETLGQEVWNWLCGEIAISNLDNPYTGLNKQLLY